MWGRREFYTSSCTGFSSHGQTPSFPDQSQFPCLPRGNGNNRMSEDEWKAFGNGSVHGGPKQTLVVNVPWVCGVTGTTVGFINMAHRKKCIIWWQHHCGGLPDAASGKEATCQYWRHERHRFDLWVRKIPWSRKWQPSPLFLPGKPHRQRILVGYSPCSHKESDTTEAS